MGRHKGKPKRSQWLEVPSGPRRRTISEPPPSPAHSEDGGEDTSENPAGRRERTRSLTNPKAVRFNIDNTLHVYEPDPNIKLAAKRSKIPRRFDGPEWSIYKALRQRKRTASESSSRSVESADDPHHHDSRTTPLLSPTKSDRSCRSHPSPPPETDTGVSATEVGPSILKAPPVVVTDTSVRTEVGPSILKAPRSVVVETLDTPAEDAPTIPQTVGGVRTATAESQTDMPTQQWSLGLFALFVTVVLSASVLVVTPLEGSLPESGEWSPLAVCAELRRLYVSSPAVASSSAG